MDGATRDRSLQEGVRAIERGLWFVGMEHRGSDIREALERADPAFAKHAAEWSPA